MSQAQLIFRLCNSLVQQDMVKMYPLHIWPPELIQTQGIQASLQSHLVFKAHWRIQRFPQRVHMCYMCFYLTLLSMLPMFNLFIFRHNVLCSSGFSYFHLVDLLVIHFWIFFSKYKISKCIIWRPFLLNQIIKKIWKTMLILVYLKWIFIFAQICTFLSPPFSRRFDLLPF